MKHLGLGTAVAIVAIAVAGCGDDDRPSDADWAVAWEAERALVPAQDELVAGGRELCDELVGTYRERFDDLRPTPSAALDDAVDAWIEQAEQIVFECSDDAAVLTDEYDELRVLEAEIDAGLAADD